jgi:hypothetical protein
VAIKAHTGQLLPAPQSGQDFALNRFGTCAPHAPHTITADRTVTCQWPIPRCRLRAHSRAEFLSLMLLARIRI